MKCNFGLIMGRVFRRRKVLREKILFASVAIIIFLSIVLIYNLYTPTQYDFPIDLIYPPNRSNLTRNGTLREDKMKVLFFIRTHSNNYETRLSWQITSWIPHANEVWVAAEANRTLEKPAENVNVFYPNCSNTHASCCKDIGIINKGNEENADWIVTGRRWFFRIPS